MISTSSAASGPLLASPFEPSEPSSSNRRRDAATIAHRQFKKHKVLPRPTHEKGYEIPVHVARAGPPKFDETIHDSTRFGHAGSQTTSPRTLKHQPRRIENGPDMPPTPPRQTRKSSSNSHGLPPSPTLPNNANNKQRSEQTRPPITPPNQQSPPTPDVTPPHSFNRSKLLQPNLGDKDGSRTTITNSRTGSFRTAHEEIMASEEEDTQTPNAKQPRSTVRRALDYKANGQVPNPNALGLALASLTHDPENSDKWRRAADVKSQPDGDWSSASEVEQEWDHNLQRMVTIKKRPLTPDVDLSNGPSTTIVESNVVTPNLATKAVRKMPLNQKPTTNAPVKVHASRKTSSGPSSSDSVVSSGGTRRTSGISTRSTVSTVVGATIVAGGRPQRTQTLRHVRKQLGLRGSPETLSSHTTASLKSEKNTRKPQAKSQTGESKHDSYATTTTVNSVASARTRREVWKNGGIPVVVVPDRRSSSKPKSSKEPSLRSHSSRRSSRRTSLDVSEAKEPATALPPLSRRGRTMSEPSDSDQRTMDFPPTIPARSSSLSAPTSRNASRTNSLTAESIKLHNALQESLAKEQKQKEQQQQQQKPQVPVVCVQGDVSAPPSASIVSDKDMALRRLSSDHHDDFLGVKSYGSMNTPFSLASVDTNGTALEVSEALAVHMYPHQNSSVLVVNHSGRPSESSDDRDQPKDPRDDTSSSTEYKTAVDDPMTPPQPQTGFNDVDSPLRNPRAPPEPPAHPPAINFIPATPSGMTPAYEKAAQMGNYFEATGEKPFRRPSLVRRAFSHRRRHSVDYPPTASRPSDILKRRFSLSRNRDKAKRFPDMERGPSYPSPDESPAEGDKLHPFWRPQWSGEGSDECDGDCCCHDDRPDDEVFRYPPIDNRPRMAQRSLSQKMKRTFAIFPPREEEYYYSSGSSRSPERRTIRRTPSGNLRIMRYRDSSDSLRRRYTLEERRRSTFQSDGRRSFWRPSGMPRGEEKGQRRLSLSSRLEEIQNIPRIISEKRREKRTSELRQKISRPREVRDGVGEVIRPRVRGQRYV